MLEVSSFSALSVEPSAESGFWFRSDYDYVDLSVLSLLSRLLNLDNAVSSPLPEVRLSVLSLLSRLLNPPSIRVYFTP